MNTRVLHPTPLNPVDLWHDEHVYFSRLLGLLRRSHVQSISIARVHSAKVAEVGHHRVGISQELRDTHRGSGRQHTPDPGWNLYGFGIAF